MNREGSIITIAAAIILSMFAFSKSLNKKNKNPNNRGILPQTSVTTITSPTSPFSSDADLAACNYEVFLSFRGIDTRLGFTDFLYTYLVGARIRTFRDGNELQIGGEIRYNLLKAIEYSKISIPIFSKNYADSYWCLCELTHIVKCQAKEGQKIFPIFYDIDASDVRNQRGSYEKAFRQHEKNFDENTVQNWREALQIVGQLKGYELKKETNGNEGELVKKVVRDVLLHLKKNYTQVPDDLIGMDHHLQEMTRLLDVDFEGVRIVGIHGMGGIGKTTIAKVLYNQVCESFEGCCFLEDVRGKANKQHNGLVNLQKQLVSQILKIDLPDIVDVDEGVNRIKDAVQRSKVLIVLDDVDDKFQFDKLVGESNWFDKSSRIIITTRNKEVLNALEVTYRRKDLLEAYKSYEPELMQRDHSLSLFSKYAFMRDSPLEDFFILSEEVVSIAAGLPLVLVTLGSLLFGEDKTTWEERVRQLKEIPNKQVLDKLRVSFSALEYEQKQIFLDIACLFIGEDKTYPYYMWEGCKYYPKVAMNVLVLRSLVKVGDDNTLRMHDQLRDLGRQIVREESMNQIGNYSRLWDKEEASDIFERGLGMENVEALNLDLGVVQENGCEQSELSEELYVLLKHEGGETYYSHHLVRQHFNQLPNLRFLRLGQAELGGNFKQLFSNLRWLEWRCRGEFIPTNLNLKNLVILDMSSSKVTDGWEGWTQFKAATRLKVLNLSRCTGLRRGPNFSMFPTLEIVNLSRTPLIELNPSLGNVITLRALDLSGCNLPKLDCSTYKDLESLNVNFSMSLLEITGLECSESLNATGCGPCGSLRTFGDSTLRRLKEINIYCCFSLTKIEGLKNLESLELLDMRSCTSIVRLPDLSNLRRLKKLLLKNCRKLQNIEGLGGLESLELLDMSGCRFVKRLPSLSSSRMLKELFLNDCVKLCVVKDLGGLESLELLNMACCKSIERLPNLSTMKRLKDLNLYACNNLHVVQHLGGLESLERLDMRWCESVEKLDLSNMGKLKVLDLNYCENLRVINGLGGLESLEVLNMACCKSVVILPDILNLKMLKELCLSYCMDLRVVKGFQGLESLECLDMKWCKSMKRLDLSNLGKLKTLSLNNCKKLCKIEGLQSLISLQSLDLTSCVSMRETLDFSNLKNLKELRASGLKHWRRNDVNHLIVEVQLCAPESSPTE